MFLLKWYREYLEIKNEALAKELEIDFCPTCEALKLELAKAHDMNRVLLSSITNPKQPEEKAINIEELKPIVPARHQTFTMRRQMMQAEDRRKADALRRQEEESRTVVKNESEIPSVKTEVDSNLTAELEAELDIVNKEREAQSGKRDEH